MHVGSLCLGDACDNIGGVVGEGRGVYAVGGGGGLKERCRVGCSGERSVVSVKLRKIRNKGKRVGEDKERGEEGERGDRRESGGGLLCPLSHWRRRCKPRKRRMEWEGRAVLFFV